MAATRVLLLNHRGLNCGVYQFGRSIERVLARSTANDVHYCELGDAEEFTAVLAKTEPHLAIANHHPLTMPWLTRDVVRRCGVPMAGIVHEFDHGNCFVVASELFDYRILPDPTVMPRFPSLFPTSRMAPEFEPSVSAPTLPTIGSFGFASGGKGFEHLVRRVQEEFDTALIRLHVPPSAYADSDGTRARATIAACRALIEKSGIILEASHDFKDEGALLEFLAGNSLNVFLYDDQPGRGVSSVVDLAVAAGRPIAVSDSRMFRALHSAVPNCRVAGSSLRAILDGGPAAVLTAKATWTPAALLARYEAIVAEILRQASLTNRPHWNCVLDDAARVHHSRAIAELHCLAPETMTRKIPRANVQQGFVMDAVKALGDDNRRAHGMLCVGDFEDTACEALRAQGYAIDGVDPETNCDLGAFVRAAWRPRQRYGVIFSTSVLEHVADDELFVEQIRDLLAPGGVAILTLDFRNDWRVGDPKPIVDHRLYTNADLLGRLVPLLHGCELIDSPRWLDAAPDFEYEGSRYGFATLVFRKRTDADCDPGEAEFACSLERERVVLLRERAVRQHATICALLYSRSWRVTEPLRILASKLGV